MSTCPRTLFRACALLALALLPAPPAAQADPATVLFFDRAEVDAAFAKGAVLVGPDTGRNFMVHASRREAAGVAEVHTLDADIIHVLEGTATFVTGGVVENAREVEAGEIRGASITGGQARRLEKGNVIVVPAGTPHWFREVPGVLTYYVVKVRR